MFMFHFMANFVNTRKNFPVGNADAPTRFLGLCSCIEWDVTIIDGDQNVGCQKQRYQLKVTKRSAQASIRGNHQKYHWDVLLERTHQNCSEKPSAADSDMFLTRKTFELMHWLRTGWYGVTKSCRWERATWKPQCNFCAGQFAFIFLVFVFVSIGVSWQISKIQN